MFAECFEGAERARESGYSVMLTATGYDPAVESAAVQGLMDHQVDGLILTVADVAKSATLDDLDSAGMPYVLVYNESASHPLPRSTTAPRPATWSPPGPAPQAHRAGDRPADGSDRARRRLVGARACAKKLGLDASSTSA